MVTLRLSGIRKTSTLYGYSETDLDTNSMVYYDAVVTARLNGHSGVITTAEAVDITQSGTASVTLSAAGSPGATYTLYGSHGGEMRFKEVVYRPCDPVEIKRNEARSTGIVGKKSTPMNLPSACPFTLFVDFYDYSSFTVDGIPYYSDDYLWTGPGPPTEESSPSSSLGSTVDQATVQTPGQCGAERDQIIAEYQEYLVPFAPTCSYFTSNRNTQYFSFPQFNYPSPGTAPARYQHAIMMQDLGLYSIGFLDRWYANSSGFSINSGYRCPSQNQAAGGAQNSQHMYGDAVDAGNPSHATAAWNALKAAAQQAGSDWIEPQSGPCGLGCVHGDLRFHPRGYLSDPL